MRLLSLSRSLRLVLVMAVMVSALAFLSYLDSATVVYAQDPQTPDALCEAATIEEPSTRSYSQAEDVLEAGIDYRAIFCTDEGAVYADLFELYTPLTVNNFVFLAQNGYYNNTTFHRVMEGFMAQAGDPTGTGSGGPGYQFGDEFLPFLGMNSAGWLAMANAGRGTNGSQFFITRAATNWLHGAHSVFGMVLEGQDVVNNLVDRQPPTDIPASKLNTVLIITDPSSVDTSYSPPEAPSADEALTAIDFAVRQLFSAGQGPAFNNLVAESRDAEGVVASYPEAVQESVQAWLETHGFEYESVGLWEVSDCPVQPDLLAIGFSISDFGSEANAESAANDAALVEAQEALGFELLESEDGFFENVGFTTDLAFARSTSDFCDGAGVYSRYIWNQGRYILAIDVVATEGAVELEQFPLILANFGFTFTGYIGDIIVDGGLPTLGFDN